MTYTSCKGLVKTQFIFVKSEYLVVKVLEYVRITFIFIRGRLVGSNYGASMSQLPHLDQFYLKICSYAILWRVTSIFFVFSKLAVKYMVFSSTVTTTFRDFNPVRPLHGLMWQFLLLKPIHNIGSSIFSRFSV